MEHRHYKAIFFDLDGTLLPMDMDEFLARYFELLNGYAAKAGLDPERFANALQLGIRAMATDESERMNNEVFWERFHEAYGSDDAAIDASIEEFYTTVFPHIGSMVVANPAASQAVSTLKEKGYKLFLTTMPLFPREAIEWRCRWAGVDHTLFERLTTYDNSYACKPSLRYYQQNIELAGCAPEEVLVVGNNTVEDLAASELGCDVYLVTDYLLDPVGFPVESVKHGSMADFAAFAAALPQVDPAPAGTDRF